MEEEIKEVKNMLRAVLQSVKEGVPAHILQRDYREITQAPLPFRKFGFNNLDDFIGSIPDVVCIKRNKTGEIMYHAVANEETQHIQKLVSKQRSAKKRRNIKPASRRPKLPSHTRPPPKPRPRRTPNKSAPPGGYFSNIPHTISPPYTGSPMHPESFQIVLNRGDNHRSVVQSGMGRALFGAMDAANKERQQQSKSYELPPRFRRLQEQTSRPIRPQPASVSRTPPHGRSGGPKRSALKVEKVVDGAKYLVLVTKYMESKNLPLKFETIPSKMNNRDFYASSIKVDGEVYGSEDIFGTRQDAEYAVCRTMCEQLNLLQTLSASGDSGKSSKLSIPDSELKSRVKKILQEKTNGLWSTRLPVVYQEEFNEQAPDDILDLVRKWKDIARVEAVEVTGRDIIYPVKEDPDRNKDLQIPLAPTLQLMQEVTVYSTFINNCGHFYVQKEDSPIDEIVEELDKISKSSHVPSPEYLTEGCHCAALYLEDKSWSRAEVISCGDDESQSKMKAMFLDYGNEESIEPGSTRWLTEKVASYPAQAISCYLRGIYYLDDQDNWSKESTVEFAKIVQEQALIAITHAYDENGFCEVDLFLASDPSVNVNQKLIEEGLVKNLFITDESDTVFNGLSIEPEPLVYPLEDQWDVYVSFVNQSTDSVMMRLVGEDYSEKLDELEFCLEQAFQEAPEELIEVGMVCVAYVESLYHRVRVLDIGEKWIECYFLDHGDTDKFIKDQLRILDPKINTSLSYQGFEASLYGLEDIAQNSAALEKLFDVALGKTCVAEIVSREDGLSVILYDTSGKDDVNINDIILKTVTSEAESSLLVASQTISPAGSVSSIPDKIKPDSAKSSKQSSPALPRKNISSPKPSSKDSTPKTSPGSTSSAQDKDSVISKQNVSPKTSVGSKTSAEPKKLTSENSSSLKQYKSPTKSPTKKVVQTQQEEAEDSDESWETESEEEEEFVELEDVEEVKTDYNSNVKRTSIDEICDSIDIKCRELIKNSSPDAKTLYTWKKDQSNDNTKNESDEYDEYDDSKLWNSTEYHKFRLPNVYAVPPVGQFCDIHVSFVFDPTNFVCNPYETLTDLNDLHQEMYHYFNTHHMDKELKDEDLKLGHMYAGEQGGLWYRIIVNKIINPGLVSVYNVDYGEYNAMTLDEIKPLPWRFWKLPQQAFKGKLIDIQPAGGALVWSEAAKYKMTQMAQDRNLVGLVCGMDDTGVVSLKLVDTSSEEDDICLHEVLLDLGFAELIATPHPHGHE